MPLTDSDCVCYCGTKLKAYGVSVCGYYQTVSYCPTCKPELHKEYLKKAKEESTRPKIRFGGGFGTGGF